MDVGTVIERLRARLEGDRLVDEALRRTVLQRYNRFFGDEPEDWEADGVPMSSPVHLRLKPPDAKGLRALETVDSLLRARWTRGLPPSFVELHRRFGALRVEIEGVEAHGFWEPGQLLNSLELNDAVSDDGTLWRPYQRFLGTADMADSVAFIFRCNTAGCMGCIGPVATELWSGELVEGTMTYDSHATGTDFAQWLLDWIESGMSLDGNTQPDEP